MSRNDLFSMLKHGFLFLGGMSTGCLFSQIFNLILCYAINDGIFIELRFAFIMHTKMKGIDRPNKDKSGQESD